MNREDRKMFGREEIEDMYRLFIRGLDESIIISEAKYQTVLSENTLWCTLLKIKLDELEERFDITIPWKQIVEENAIREMETALQHEEIDTIKGQLSENKQNSQTESERKHLTEI